jgi:phosphoethanolamine N-methyltransferase
MNRREAVLTYWSSKPPHITSMLLKKNAELIHEEEKPELLKLLPPFAGKTVLDLGAGIGRFTAEFAKTAKKVVAVDLCPHFIEANKQANSSHTNIEWICSDALDLNFKPQQFDLIFIYGVLMYLPETELQLLEQKLRLWLKPKGTLFFVESCAPVTHFSKTEMYYAHYRSTLDYDKLFKNWTLLNQGNIQAYEDLLADPLKCFWHYG